MESGEIAGRKTRLSQGSYTCWCAIATCVGLEIAKCSPMAVQLRTYLNSLPPFWLALVVGCALAAPAQAQAPKPGPSKAPEAKSNYEVVASLGKSILESKSKKERKRLVRKALALSESEQRLLVAWCSRQAEDPRLGRFLPILRQISSDGSATLLAALAGASLDEPYRGSLRERALRDLVQSQETSRSIPLLVRAVLTSSDSSLARAHSKELLHLVKEGRGAEKTTKRSLRKAVVRAIRDVLKTKEGAASRAAAFVSDWLEVSDHLADLLDEFKRHLDRPDRAFLNGLLQGVTKRSRSLNRPIHLVRAQEINRRKKLSESQRDDLPALEAWLVDRIKQDKRLSRVKRRVEKEDAIFEDLLIELIQADESSTLLKVEVLKLAPAYAKTPDSDWIPVLIDLLEDRALSQRAYRLLRSATGEKLPLNSFQWNRWLSGASGAAAEPETPEPETPEPAKTPESKTPETPESEK